METLITILKYIEKHQREAGHDFVALVKHNRTKTPNEGDAVRPRAASLDSPVGLARVADPDLPRITDHYHKSSQTELQSRISH